MYGAVDDSVFDSGVGDEGVHRMGCHEALLAGTVGGRWESERGSACGDGAAALIGVRTRTGGGALLPECPRRDEGTSGGSGQAEALSGHYE